ncbi:MAG: M13 family metallopeptidase [Hyphomonadaceae bacterium]|nr:M13 family metallopeptidase [Hyphomonadaceae bacterium]
MINLTRRAMAASSLALIAGCATRAPEAPPAPAAAPRPRPTIGSFGIDLDARDLSVDPGDDFFRYASGTWLRNTPIPEDRTRWGAFEILRDKADRDVRVIVEEVVAAGGAPGSSAQKVADYYSAYLNQDAIDAAGLAPAQADLAAIAAIRTHEDAIRLVARPDMPVNAPIALYISLDQRNPDAYVVGMTHAGLGLPEREYYRRTDGEFPNIRNAYVAHIGRMLTLAGVADADAKARAILAFETRIAELHWEVARRRERDQTYNRKTRAEINALDGRFPWDAAFDECGLGEAAEVVVRELDAMGPLARLSMQTPVATWRAYLTYHYLRNTAHVLPRAFDDEQFSFFGATLNGQPQQRARWQRAIDATNGAVGEAIGQLYVARHFTPEAKAQMQALVENLRRAYGERIDQLRWMSPETKVVAREKLAAFRPKIGYPDRWKDYAGLEVRAGDAFGNVKRAAVFDWNEDLRRLNQPTDRDEWFMTPQTVNAYYNPVFNEIVFPAAILQAPFFDQNADPAVNYGAIGGVIGHEMGHGFDDQGAKSDARGVLRDWWNERDVAAFRELGDKLAAQYSRFEPLEGINLNGRLGLGENIGDNGGLQVALAAYRIATAGAEVPVLDGITGDQRFFLAWAQVWREAIREQRLRNQIMTGPHSPAEFRCNGVVRNIDAWYAAFDVQPDDALYLPPEERVLIW